MRRSNWIAPAAIVVAGLFAGGVMAACSDDDNDARQDLAVDNQMYDESVVSVGVFPDGWPNPAHKCMELNGLQVGVWSTTERGVALIYNDHACPGANMESTMTTFVIAPRPVTSSGG